MREKKGLFACVFAVLFVLMGCGSVYAANFLVFNSTSVEKNYAPGEFVRGNLKISFNNQTDANFTSAFAGGISLLDLLEKSGSTYTCVPSSCETVFKTSGNGNTEISINPSENKTYGFRINGKDASVNSLEFHVRGSGGSSCQNQIKIDLLADGVYELSNDRYVDEECTPKNYGCFNSANSEKATIPSDSYCEKMNLSTAPAYRVGAKVEKGTHTGELRMEMWSAETGDSLGECELPEQTESIQDISCIVEHSSAKKFEAFVCISAETGTDYKIKTETDRPCGLIGADTEGELVADYEIFAQGLKYGPLNVSVNSTTFEKLNPGQDLAGVIQEYIKNRYDRNCVSGCVIPMRVSGSNENVIIDSVELNYDVSGALGKTTGLIYGLSEDKPKISSSQISLDLEDMRFSVPGGNGIKSFELKLDSSLVLRENINVSSGFEFNVSPKTAFLGISTNFRVISDYSISSVDWQFGDGAVETTSTNDVEHIYNKSGSYTLVAEAKKANGEKSRRSFVIEVGNAQESAALLISRYESRVPNITAQINAYPEWIKSELNRKLNISEMINVINSSKREFSSAVSESDYEKIVNNLLRIDVPTLVMTSLSGNDPASLYYGKINPSHIEEISRNASADENLLKNAIMGWMEGNYNVNEGFNVISAFGDSGRKDLVTVIKLSVTPKKTGVESSYLIIDYPLSAIKLKENYSARALTGGAGMALPGDFNGEREFLIRESIDVGDLGIYISPDVQSFANIISPQVPEKKGFPKWMFLGLVIGLIIITFLAYIALQEWYKRRYESYLFKNRDDLYNLIRFISNGRKSGLKDEEIKDKLKKSGWKSEQIDYSVRKLDGKRTGMYEIPIFRIFERAKLNLELKKRQQDVTLKR